MRGAVMQEPVMRMRSSRWLAVTLVVVAGAATISGGRAQVAIENLPLSTTYGAGVHAFFSGDLERSYDALTAAIAAGTRDPRAWYFRGLAALRMGRLDEAEADFSEGAAREIAAVGGWPVSRSLERVQGAERLQLERHRTRARVAALERDREARQRRYVEIDEAAPEVLRARRPTPPPVAPGDVFGGGGAAAEPLDLPSPREEMDDPDDALPRPDADADDPFANPPMRLEADSPDVPAEAAFPVEADEPFVE
jgi:hypothetical protein